MANKERGEWTLVAGAERYTLRLTTNACCELEEFAGKPFDDIQRLSNRGSLVAVRYLLWASLQEHHSDLATPDKEGLKRIGAIIDAGGGLLGLLAQIKAFLAWNADSGLPPSKDKGGAARPQDAQAGTGGSSTLTH